MKIVHLSKDHAKLKKYCGNISKTTAMSWNVVEPRFVAVCSNFVADKAKGVPNKEYQAFFKENKLFLDSVVKLILPIR